MAIYIKSIYKVDVDCHPMTDLWRYVVLLLIYLADNSPDSKLDCCCCSSLDCWGHLWLQLWGPLGGGEQGAHQQGNHNKQLEE